VMDGLLVVITTFGIHGLGGTNFLVVDIHDHFGATIMPISVSYVPSRI
jgi:hypothetical protein